MIKYNGIDERQIKCSCDNENCRQGGISFDENVLRFHFLDNRHVGDLTYIDQFTRSMVLSKETAADLINKLKDIVDGN